MDAGPVSVVSLAKLVSVVDEAAPAGNATVATSAIIAVETPTVTRRFFNILIPPQELVGVHNWTVETAPGWSGPGTS
jgi:hypothetical protein